jgi:CrcB protein
MTRELLFAWLVVASGGALGASLRWLAGLWLSRPGFPWVTLGVNVLGSGLIGLCWVLFAARDAAHPWRAFIMVGLLGGFTTFSAFSLETLQLLEQGQAARAGLYVLASVTLCLLACWIGLLLARQL